MPSDPVLGQASPLRPGDVLVIDLDGTLLPGNSFHLWLRHLLLHGLPGARLGGRLVLLRAIALRALGRASHAAMKARVMQLWQAAEARAPHRAEAQLIRFAKGLASSFRPELIELAWEARERDIPCLLATAAPLPYARALNRRGPFDAVVASRLTPHGLDETLGARKAAEVRSVMAARGWAGRPFVLATDHADDLPLCRLSLQVLWYGPPAEGRRLCATKILPEPSARRALEAAT
ncbi:HAD family hydrolase [Pseudoroseicyclus sp. H15]